MTPVELSRTLQHAVRRAVDEGKLDVTVPERVLVAPPGPGGCGEYATNLALQLAKPAGRPPRGVAEVLRPYLTDVDGITDVVVTGPGFLNFSLAPAAPAALVRDVLRLGPRYGHLDHAEHQEDTRGSQGPHDQSVHLRCLPEIRAVVVMDTVARLMRARGALVRTTCAAPLPEEWVTGLGVRVDAVGEPTGVPASSETVTIKPVPAGGDPGAVLALGRDAARWALLHPAAHDRVRVSGEHLVQRESNPLFRVRYAHARCRRLLRNAADLDFTPEAGPTTDSMADSTTDSMATGPTTGTVAGGPTTGTDTHSAPLLTLLADHPRTLGAAARHRAPDRLARHLVVVADAVLPLLPAVLPFGDEKPSAAHRARLALAAAAGAVLAGGLSLLGIDAPEHL
ncbi:ArgS-related anticodon-binding protein NrtL [Streptomyces ziwulingensis]|uniref:arginine--tRNA ligase n=1 Tax=Streptomyces ziwulingensis TaxID=1045501 RepID=A0ABP9B791_9ACTN